MLIDSRQALLALSGRIGLLGVGRADQLVVRLGQLTPVENERIQAQLTGLYDACGCGWAATLAIVAPVTFGVYLPFAQSTGAVWGVLSMAGLFIAGGAAGKVIGLLIARERLRRRLRQLLLNFAVT